MKIDINGLFDSDTLDTTRVLVTRIKLQGLKNIGVSLNDVKKEGVHFYLDGQKEFHTLLLPKFYAALIIASEGNEEDDVGPEYHDKGEYSFIFRMTIPLKDDPSANKLYYLWFVINNIDGIYVQLLVPHEVSGEIATFEDFINPTGELRQMMENLANIWILNFQEKGLIPYPYAKFCDQLLYMFGYSEKDSEYFYHQYENEKKYKQAKKTMMQDLIKELQ